MPTIRERYADGTEREFTLDYDPRARFEELLSAMRAAARGLIELAHDVSQEPSSNELRQRALDVAAVCKWALDAPPVDVARYAQTAGVRAAARFDLHRTGSHPAAVERLSSGAERLLAALGEPTEAGLREVMSTLLEHVVNDGEMEVLREKYGNGSGRTFESMVDAAVEHRRRAGEEKWFEPEGVVKAVLAALDGRSAKAAFDAKDIKERRRGKPTEKSAPRPRRSGKT